MQQRIAGAIPPCPSFLCTYQTILRINISIPFLSLPLFPSILLQLSFSGHITSQYVPVPCPLCLSYEEFLQNKFSKSSYFQNNLMPLIVCPQYLLICNSVAPTMLQHPSPLPRFKTLQTLQFVFFSYTDCKVTLSKANMKVISKEHCKLHIEIMFISVDKITNSI